MKAGDIKVGMEVGVLDFPFRDRFSTGDGFKGRPAAEWEHLENYARRALVLETGVVVGGYARPGTRVVYLDRASGERLKHMIRGEMVEHIREVQNPRIAARWEEVVNGVCDYREHVEERAERQARERAEQKAREQERAAKGWMERVFREARSDLDDVAAVGFLFDNPDEGMVRALVEHRYPEGNPYLPGLNGEPPRREAH